jgi:putative membrane protein
MVPLHLAAQLDLWLALPFVLALVGYGLAALTGRRRGSWPRYRVLLWTAGTVVCLVATVGPLAARGDTSFVAHMVSHLLLGMLGPLLLVLAAPVSLALRTLPVTWARRLVALLASRPVRLATDPVTAAVLDLAGVWLLYTTPLLALSQHSAAVHVLVHAHLLLWGYLFTASVVGRDPVRHRRGYPYRSAVLVGFLAVHGILAKVVYSQPPVGVEPGQAARGAMVMYYGGDAVHLALLVVLGSRWFSSTRPRPALDRQPA